MSQKCFGCGISSFLSPTILSPNSFFDLSNSPPPPPQNCRFLCFPIDVELSVLETVVSEKSKNFLRTTFRRGDCYKTINHGRKSHFLDGFSWLEPHDNIILVGELPCLVKHIMNSAASTAVYPCDF